MGRLTRILAALTIAVLCVGPVSAATPSSKVDVAQAVTTAMVDGTIVDEGGRPIPGVTVTLTGPRTYRTTTDAKGLFSLYGVEPGVYGRGFRRYGDRHVHRSMGALRGRERHR